MNLDVGERLRAVRRMYGLSQRELARRAGVTNGSISLIEKNRVSPSVSSLRKLLAGIPLSLAEFFTTDFAARQQVFFAREELADLGTGNVTLELVAAQRKGRAMSILRETYPPGTDTGAEMLSHPGEEGGIVVRGEIELRVGGATRVLGPGDAYYFESNLPHRFRNPGEVECEIISASSPPTF